MGEKDKYEDLVASVDRITELATKEAWNAAIDAAVWEITPLYGTDMERKNMRNIADKILKLKKR